MTTADASGRRQLSDAHSRNLPGDLDYARNLYANVLDWYKTADAKGQTLLTINGALLTIVAGVTLSNAEDLAKFGSQAGWETWLFLSAAAVALIASLVCAIQCLRSRLARGHIRAGMRAFGVDREMADPYLPEDLWWFGHIAQLQPEKVEARLKMADANFERDALLSQITRLSNNVLEKHQWVNVGWLLTGFTLISIAATAISYVIRVTI